MEDVKRDTMVGDEHTGLHVLVYALIFLTPYSVYFIQFGAGIGLTPINILTLAMIPVLILWLMFQEKIPTMSAVGSFQNVYILVMLISCTVAADKLAALRISGAYFLKFFLVFVYVVYFLRERRHMEKGVQIFILAGVLNAFMGWVELIGYAAFGKMIFPPFAELIRGGALTTKAFGYDTGSMGIPGFVRMFGFLHEGANYFGPYTVIPMGLSYYWAKQYNSRKYLWLAIFFSVTIVVSASRSGILGMIVFFVFLHLMKRRQSSEFFPLIKNAAMICAVASVVLFAARYVEKEGIFAVTEVQVTESDIVTTPNALVERMNPFKEDAMKGSQVYFMDHFRLALVHGFDNFGFGMGGSNFDEFVFQFYNVRFGSHSNLIIFLGDTGIWGLFVQVIIAILTISCGLKTYRIMMMRRDDHLAIYLTAIFTGILVTGIVRTHYQDTYAYIVMGLIVRSYLNARLVQRKELGIESEAI